MYERKGWETQKEAHNRIFKQIGKNFGENLFNLAQEVNLDADEVKAIIVVLSTEGHLSATNIWERYNLKNAKVEKDTKVLGGLHEL